MDEAYAALNITAPGAYVEGAGMAVSMGTYGAACWVRAWIAAHESDGKTADGSSGTAVEHIEQLYVPCVPIGA